MPLSIRDIERIASIREEDINLSDIPEADKAWFERARLKLSQSAPTIPSLLLRAQLAASLAQGLTIGKYPVMDNHEFLVNDLRNKVEAGEDISAEEMLVIVNSIRRGRRTAAPAAARGTKTKRAAGAVSAPEDLGSLLDQTF